MIQNQVVRRRTNTMCSSLSVRLLVLALLLGLLGVALLPSPSIAKTLYQTLDDGERPLIAPTSYEIVEPKIYEDRNGKESDLYLYKDDRSYRGQHHYTCGVKNSYSTYAYYDFGSIWENGSYEVFAYWPGFEESVANRNNGFGNFSVYIDGGHIRNWKEDDQYGGWERIHFGDGSIWGKYHGRASLEKRYLNAGQRLSFTIHNGNNSKVGTCGNPGSRVVFPPLLLVRIEDYARYRPYSPAHDIYPPAALDFVNCLTNAKPAVNLPVLTAATIEKLILGFFGEAPGMASFGTLNHINNVRQWQYVVRNCEELMWESCRPTTGTDPSWRQPKYHVLNQWHYPKAIPNTSVIIMDSLLGVPMGSHQLLRYNRGDLSGWYPQWDFGFCGGYLDGPHSYGVLKMMPIGLEMDANASNGLR